MTVTEPQATYSGGYTAGYGPGGGYGRLILPYILFEEIVDVVTDEIVNEILLSNEAITLLAPERTIEVITDQAPTVILLDPTGIEVLAETPEQPAPVAVEDEPVVVELTSDVVVGEITIPEHVITIMRDLMPAVEIVTPVRPEAVVVLLDPPVEEVFTDPALEDDRVVEWGIPGVVDYWRNASDVVIGGM